MKFEIVKDKDENKYVWLKEVKLQQNLISAYEVKTKDFLVLDESDEDYAGSPYTEFIKVKIGNKDKQLGIVQRIKADQLIAVSEILVKVMSMYAK